MNNIRYIVIFDLNQHPLYIYDLDLNKIIDVQKYKILYQINRYSFKKPFITPLLKYFKFCIKFLNENNCIYNESQTQKFLKLMKEILIFFRYNYCQYFSDDNLFKKK
jgi:hypothetical protein